MLGSVYFVLVVTSLFFILDPFANIPIFSALTKNFSLHDRVKTVRKSHLIAFLAFVFFCLFGNFIFNYLGIQFSSFKIAGGILLFLISMEMLFGYKTRTEMTEDEHDSAEEKENVAITPLAIPLIAGPGAITTGIVLLSKAVGVSQLAEFVIGAAGAFLLSYLMLRHSDPVRNVLGPIGLKVLTRIMGLLLMSLAIQFVINGIREAGLLALV